MDLVNRGLGVWGYGGVTCMWIKIWKLQLKLFCVFQSQVPDQIMKMLNATFTDDNHLFTPLKKFPDTFSEQDR